MRPERHIGLYVKWLLKLSNSNKELNSSTIFFLRFSDTTFSDTTFSDTTFSDTTFSDTTFSDTTFLETRLSVLEFIHLCAWMEGWTDLQSEVNPLNAELNPICYLLALLAQNFLHISRIRVKSLTLRLLMSYIYIYGAHILDVSRSHTTTHHSR